MSAEDEGPSKRLKISPEEEEIIDLEESEDGNPEEDVKLENQLRDAQADLDKIHEEMLARLREVEQEFELKKVPFYKARGEVIKSIPGFWLHCFLQHQEVKSVIGEVDEQVLRSLVEVVADSLAGSKEGYKLSFKFAENEWFEDALLTKEVNFVIDGATGSQTCTTSGSSPKWKKQDPTVGGGKGTPEGAPFLSWLLTELSLEPGLADTLADIIKDQLYVNPLEYLEADNDLEYPGHEGDYLEDEDLEEGQDDDDDDDALDEYQEGSELAEGKTDEGHGVGEEGEAGPGEEDDEDYDGAEGEEEDLEEGAGAEEDGLGNLQQGRAIAGVLGPS